MTGAIADSLHFTAHLFALTVAFGAVFVVIADSSERGFARAMAVLGFLSLAAGEAIHGAAFEPDFGDPTVLLRTAGYGLLALYALAGRPATSAGAPAALALPGRVVPPVAAALFAALVLLIRRRDGRHRWLALGLVGLAGADGIAMLDVRWAEIGYHAARSAGYLAVSGFVLGATRRSIQFRIVAGFVAVLLVVVLGISAAVTQILSRNLRQSTLDRVTSSARAIEEGLKPLISSKIAALKSFAGQRKIVNAVRSGRGVSTPDVSEIQGTILPDTDFVLILDATGGIQGRSSIPFDRANALAGSDLVDRRAQGTVASIDREPGRGLILMGVAPMEVDGELIGFVVTGIRIDRAFLERVAPGTGQAAVFAGSPPVPITTLGIRTQGSAPILRQSVIDAVWERFGFGAESEARPLTLGGERSFGAFVPLRRPDNRAVGMLLVAEPGTVLGETLTTVNRVIFLVTLGVVGLALLLAFVMARRISSPVRALTTTARRVQAGDLEARAPISGPDEVGDLALAFNQMTDSVSLMTDELRAAATEQATLRSRLETVVNSMSDGLIAVDDTGRIVTFNRGAGSILGLRRPRVIGKKVDEVLRLEDDEGHQLPLDESLPAGTAFVRRRSGARTPVAIASSPLRTEEGDVLGQVFVMRDMTREYEVERMKTEFLANVSHELRTPLTPIIGYSEILQKKEVTRERSQEFAAGILESARRLERIVAMLVDFSAIEGGRLSISAEPTQVKPLISEVVKVWKERAGDHRFALKVDKELPPAVVDAPLVRRTLDELLDNAVKYSPGGGTVTVSATSENSRKRRMLKIQVADEGIGIEPGDISGIFEDFRQVDASDTRAYGGLGLGLAFVKRIVEAHGGTIIADSEPGHGTVFSFTLPAAAEPRRSVRS